MAFKWFLINKILHFLAIFILSRRSQLGSNFNQIDSISCAETCNDTYFPSLMRQVLESTSYTFTTRIPQNLRKKSRKITFLIQMKNQGSTLYTNKQLLHCITFLTRNLCKTYMVFTYDDIRLFILIICMNDGVANTDCPNAVALIHIIFQNYH